MTKQQMDGLGCKILREQHFLIQAKLLAENPSLAIPPPKLVSPKKKVPLLAPSGALVFIMVYYIPAAQQASHFSKFFKFFRFESESESERTQHVLYF